MDQDKQLKGASAWQYKPRNTESNLGDEVSNYLKRRNREFGKNTQLVDLWQYIVPPTLQRFCRLDKRVGSTLYVKAQPGPYMHQLQMITEQLLEQIHRQIPRSGIQKIKITPEDQTNKE